MKKLLTMAKQILDNNPNALLTGSLMLYLRGIDLGREPKDIDILLNDYAGCLKLPDNPEPEYSGSGFASATYKVEDVKIDVLASGMEEDAEVIQGIRCASLKMLIDVKMKYSQQTKGDPLKHHEDLKKMGYVLPVLTSDNELPF